MREKNHKLNNTDSQGLVLVEKYGAPLYVYDAEIIERQFDRLKKAFGVPHLDIHYACKALTNLSILKFMHRLGAGLDTVSIQEVRLGLEAGFEPSRISFTPNCVSIAEILEAHALGVRMNIDSIPVLEQFAQLRPDTPVCIRINPHILAGGTFKTSVGHVDSKFGISVHQMPHVHRIVQATGIRVNGLHMHTGSDILEADAFMGGAEILLSCAAEFGQLDFLDFGSGFKVPYKDGDIETNIEDLGKKLARRFMEFCKAYGRDLTLVLEPGKFLVSEAGSLLVQVNVVKNTTSTQFAGVDSGLNHLIRPMFYNAYHHISNLSNPAGTPRFYSVVGYICETDTFGANRLIPEIREGDILRIHNAGAYGFSMASQYNSRFRPAEVALYKGKDTLIRRRETMEDILRNQTGEEL